MSDGAPLAWQTRRSEVFHQAFAHRDAVRLLGQRPARTAREGRVLVNADAREPLSMTAADVPEVDLAFVDELVREFVEHSDHSAAQARALTLIRG